jgi:hypothetical protein
MRIEMLYLRGRCALAASDGPSGDASLVKEADRCARSLAKESMAWAAPLGDVLAAGVLRRRGEDEASLDRLRRAVDGLTRVGLLLVAASARRRLGVLTTDVTLVDGADAWLANEAVVRPDRVSALLAPV